MAFSFTCYGNDETIESTSIYVPDINQRYSVPYGDTLNVSGFSYNIRFTANPAENCSFTRWVYRVGSVSGTVQYSYSNPFTYTGSQDIYIRAEGEADDIEEPIYWGVSGETATDVGDWGASIEGQLSEYTVIRCPLCFDIQGYVDINLECDSNVELYLGSDDVAYGDEIDFETGMPLYYIDSSSKGYIRQSYVSDSSVATYYIFIRGKTGTETGYFRLVISSPWHYPSGTLSVPETGTSLQTYVSKLSLTRYSVTFAKSGNATISITGNFPVICWVGTQIEHELNSPSIYDAYGEHLNISIPYSVEQGVTYYIWLRSYEHATSGAITLNISYDDGTSIKKWSWSASNSTAIDHVTSASVTLNSYYALNKDNPTSDFSHLVWMDMVDKVWEVIWNKTKYWDDFWADKDTTRNLPQNSDGLYELTAVAFNSLRNNIELIGNRSDVLGRKTGIGQVFAQNANYPVKAEYFLTLADYINDCIDNL